MQKEGVDLINGSITGLRCVLCCTLVLVVQYFNDFIHEKLIVLSLKKKKFTAPMFTEGKLQPNFFSTSVSYRFMKSENMPDGDSHQKRLKLPTTIH